MGHVVFVYTDFSREHYWKFGTRYHGSIPTYIILLYPIYIYFILLFVYPILYTYTFYVRLHTWHPVQYDISENCINEPTEQRSVIRRRRSDRNIAKYRISQLPRVRDSRNSNNERPDKPKIVIISSLKISTLKLLSFCNLE